MLVDSPYPFLQISWQLIIGVSIAITAFFLVTIGFAVKAMQKKPATGREGLIGEEGIVIAPLKPMGTIEVHGEIWKAISATNIKKGQPVIVEEVDRKQLRLKVKPLN